MVYVTHDRDDRWPLNGFAFVELFDVKQAAHFFFALFTAIDHAHNGTDRLGEAHDLLVRQRLRRHDHLAALQEITHNVSCGAVELRAYILSAAITFDDDRS